MGPAVGGGEVVVVVVLGRGVGTAAGGVRHCCGVEGGGRGEGGWVFGEGLCECRGGGDVVAVDWVSESLVMWGEKRELGWWKMFHAIDNEESPPTKILVLSQGS